VNGKIKITDFGLSKPELSEADVTYSYCGSPEYMAPEMLAKYKN
jgi:serum/glucocorticoid-regulated kinase 2